MTEIQRKFPYECVYCKEGFNVLSTSEQIIDKDLICVGCLEKLKEEESEKKVLVSFKRLCWCCKEDRREAKFQMGSFRWKGDKDFTCKECFIKFLIFEQEKYSHSSVLITYDPKGFMGYNWANDLVRKYYTHQQNLTKAFSGE